MRLFVVLVAFIALSWNEAASQTTDDIPEEIGRYYACVLYRADQYEPLGESLSDTIDAAVASCHQEHRNMVWYLSDNGERFIQGQEHAELFEQIAREHAMVRIMDRRLEQSQ